MSGILWTAVGVVGTLSMTAIGDMVSEEVRDRLDHLPHAILRLAARRLDPAQRVAVYDDEWQPELTYILKGDEARPITRLYHGTRFALGILVSVGRIAGTPAHKAPLPIRGIEWLLGVEIKASSPMSSESDIFAKQIRESLQASRPQPSERDS